MKYAAEQHNSKALFKIGVIWSEGEYEEDGPTKNRENNMIKKDEKNEKDKNEEDRNE